MATAERRIHASELIAAKLRQRPGLTEQELADELAAEVDPALLSGLLETLSRALRAVQSAGADQLDPEVWGPRPSEEELADARKQALVAHEAELSRVLASSLSRDEAAHYLGISSQAVSERLKARRLTALRRGREWRFPGWQFNDGDTVAGLADLIDSWPGTPLALSVWANDANAGLDERSPARELSRRGGPERVLAAVRALTATW